MVGNMKEKYVNSKIHNKMIQYGKRQKSVGLFFVDYRRKCFLWHLMSALFLAIMLLLNIIGAEGSQQGASFSIRPILPENQERESSTFFDIRVEPGHEQSLEIEVLNHTNETIHIAVSIYTATTNANGIPEYQVKQKMPDINLPYLMEDIIIVPPYIEIPPYSTFYLPIKVKVPSIAYDGVLAGGIEIRPTAKYELEAGGIRNTYSFLTVILLHQGESVEPKIISNGSKILFANGECVLSTNFQNTKGAFTKSLEIESIIIKEETNEVIFENRTGNMQMAPYSNFCFSLTLEERLFSHGTYIISHTLQSGDMKWRFKELIRITGETNPRGYSVLTKEICLWELKSERWYASGVLLIVGIIFAVFLLNQRRNYGADTI